MLSILCAALFAFAPALGFGFVYDDVKQVLGNPALQSWGGLTSGFTEQVWAFDANKRGPGGYYRPLFITSLTLAHHTFGVQPAGYHAVQIVLHVAAGVLVFALGGALKLSSFARLFGTGLFLLHPLQIQAVSWVSAVTDPLLALAVLSGQLAWIAFLRSGRRRFAFAAAFAYLVGLLILERALLAGASFLLLSALQRRLELGPPDTNVANATSSIRTKQLIAHAALFALPVLIVLVARRYALGEVSSLPQDAIYDSLRAGPAAALRYARNFAWPEQLSLAYPERLRPSPTLATWLMNTAGGAGLLALIGFASYRRPQREWLASSALLLMAANLCVGLLPGATLIQDRYAYLPLAYAGLWIGDAIDTCSKAGRGARLPRLGAASVVSVWLLLLVVWHRPNLDYWRDNLALYSRAVETDPDNPHFMMNLLNERGRHGLAEPDCTRLTHVTDLLRRDPRAGDLVLAHFNLGNCLRAHGHPREALREYESAQHLANGRMLSAGINTVVAHWELGDPTTAEREARSLVHVHPNAAGAWRVLGVTLARRGAFAEARGALQHAVQLDPTDRDSARMLATTNAAP